MSNQSNNRDQRNTNNQGGDKTNPEIIDAVIREANAAQDAAESIKEDIKAEAAASNDKPKFTARAKAKIQDLFEVEGKSESMTSALSGLIAYFSAIYYGISGILYAVAALLAFLIPILGLLGATATTVLAVVFLVPPVFNLLIKVADGLGRLAFNIVHGVVTTTSSIFSKKTKLSKVQDTAAQAVAV